MKHFLDPEEVLLDASNLPSFDKQQFEGQIERPIGKKSFHWLGLILFLALLVFFGRALQLQLISGRAFAERSANNILRQTPIFAERGIISDRFGKELAWNDEGRRYLEEPGFAHVLGYISRPTGIEVRDQNFHPDELIGREGAEKIYNDQLRGRVGLKIEEVDVAGQNHSDYLLESPAPGEDLILSIDARLQAALYRAIAGLVEEGRFAAGAGVVMDVTTGEILALTSIPEYDSNVLAGGVETEKINALLGDEGHPFLNRAVAGLYTPGSIVKPIIAAAALNEKVITPEKQIFSSGQLIVSNPFFPDQPSVFKDWKAHGWVDLRRALAVSSNVYFYAVGGGIPGQRGLGIERIARYADLFGLGRKTGSVFIGEEAGTVPTPEWKRKNFAGADWLLGDTYHTVIGQYGFQVTPLQIVRAAAAIGNGGRLVTPTVLARGADETPTWETIPDVEPEVWTMVREGMRLSVTDGIASGLNLPNVAVAAKTGTAELGAIRELVNAWVTGFFPYDHPRYAFAVVMERGKRDNTIGAIFVMRQVFDWLSQNAPEYFKS